MRVLMLMSWGWLGCMPSAGLEGLPPPCADGWFERDGICVRGRAPDSGVALDADLIDGAPRDSAADVGIDAMRDVDAGIDGGGDAGPADAGPRVVRLAPVIAHELIDNGNDYRAFYATGEANRLYAGWWSGARSWVVLRYDLSEIPVGAEITSASLVAKVEGVSGPVADGPELLEVRVEDSAEPAAITTHEHAPDSPSGQRRGLRASSAGWSGRPWPVGSSSRSSDLTALLSDWQTLGGSAMHLWISSSRTEARLVGFPHPTLDASGAPHLELTFHAP